MKSPVKFNYNYLPKLLHPYLPVARDLREIIKPANMDAETYSKYMYWVYMGGNDIFKTTKPNRHSETNKIVVEFIEKLNNPAILDVGASDGSTSLDLIKQLGKKFSRYIVTDMSFKQYAIEKNGRTYFYDNHSKICLTIVSDKLVIYNDKNACVFPINSIAKKIISKAPAFNENDAIDVNLCQPGLLDLVKHNPRIVLKEWNILEQWDGEKVDFIKAANILNKEFFSDEILLKAIENIKKALKVGGFLLVLRNSAIEEWSLFRLKGEQFSLENSGKFCSEIQNLVLGAQK